MIKIRPATYADSEALAKIQVDSYRSAYAGILPQSYLDAFTYEEQTQNWRDLLVQPQDYILLVAETENGEIVGYALGHAGETQISPYDSELDALHVRRSDQGQGSGRALIAAMAHSLAEAGAVSLMLWVLKQNPARALYERLGGQPLGRRPITLDEGDVMAEEVAYGWEDIRRLEG
jgi:ribosomal protein S18 acetylase RimI-like enzyme